MAFNAANPAAGIEARQLDNDCRTNFAGLETLLNVDHECISAGLQSGKHRQLTFLAPIATPAADQGQLYSKDANSKVELHWQDEDGNEIRLTDVGRLALAKNTYLVGIDNAGTGQVDLIKANASDDIEIGGDTKLNGTLEVTSDLTCAAFTASGVGAFGGALAMGSNKITGLAAGTASGDALRVGQLGGTTIELSGGNAELVAAQVAASHHADGANYEAATGAIYASATKNTTWETLSTGLGKRALCFLKLTADATGGIAGYKFRSAAESAEVGRGTNVAYAQGCSHVPLEDNRIGYVICECDSSGNLEWRAQQTSTKKVTVTLVGHLE